MRKFGPFFLLIVCSLVPCLGQGILWVHGSEIPKCLAGQKILPIDNEQVLVWKKSTKNQFLSRAHVNGSVSRLFPDRNGHIHFEIRIGELQEDTLEVIYNSSFGKLPSVKSGMEVQACGDYITSTQATIHYPPSPSGAIIHWIHWSPSPRHDSGFVAIDGVLYGQGSGRGNPEPLNLSDFELNFLDSEFAETDLYPASEL